MVNKKAQIKIQQMAFMLVALTLFFALIGLFFLSIFSSGLGRMAESLQQEKALMLVSRLANSPEFACGEAFGGARTNCIDFDKVIHLKDINFYEKNNFWGVDRIEIRKIYPESPEICNIDNYDDCGRIEVLKLKDGGVGFSNFVSLCRKEIISNSVHDRCELAKLIVYYGGEI